MRRNGLDQMGGEYPLDNAQHLAHEFRFGRFDNPVLALHRLAIGSLPLDLALAPEDSRQLTRVELGSSFRPRPAADLAGVANPA
jgi:hypothetical protein